MPPKTSAERQKLFREKLALARKSEDPSAKSRLDVLVDQATRRRLQRLARVAACGQSEFLADLLVSIEVSLLEHVFPPDTHEWYFAPWKSYGARDGAPSYRAGRDRAAKAALVDIEVPVKIRTRA